MRSKAERERFSLPDQVTHKGTFRQILDLLVSRPFLGKTNQKKGNVPSASALHIASNAPHTCVYYNSDNHKPEHCQDNSVSAHKEKLRKQGRCYVCLGPKHIAKFCRGKGVSCALCGHRHHQSVCDQSEAKPDADSGSIEAVVSSVSATL